MGVRTTLTVVIAALAVAAFGASNALAQDAKSHPICGPEVKELQIERPYTRQVGDVVFGGGVVAGAKRNVFKEITNAQVVGDGYTASNTSDSFTVVASAAAEGTTGKLTVTYDVQPQTLVMVGKALKRLVWQNDGGPVARTCHVQLYVPLQAIEVVVLVEGTALVKLAGTAVASEVKPQTTPEADVELSKDGKQIVVTGKKEGTANFSVVYRIGTRKFKLPLKVQVLGKDGAGVVSGSVELEVGQTKELRAADLKLKDGAFVPANIQDAICDLTAADQTIKVVGRQEGKKSFTFTYQIELVNKNGKKTIAAMKVIVEVTVTKKTERVEQPGQPAPNPPRHP